MLIRAGFGKGTTSAVPTERPFCAALAAEVRCPVRQIYQSKLESFQNYEIKRGGGHFGRLPSNAAELRSAGQARAPVPYVIREDSGGFAGAFAFQHLFAADVDLDLLGLGFSFLRKGDL
jgi:hypothetical protein